MASCVAGEYAVRIPRPGTIAERQVMAAAQPGFLEASCDGVQRARAASVARGDGNAQHTAVNHWSRFTTLGLRVSMRRVLDPIASSLDAKLSEVDLMDAFAWWLVEHVKVNSETAWSYICVANSWHERAYGVGFAGGLSLSRVKDMLTGWQRLQGRPVTHRVRYGVRPRRVRDLIRASLSPATCALHANVAAAFEVALVAIARMGELVPGRGSWTAAIHPSRADVVFRRNRDDELCGCTLYICNIKARGAERFRRLPVHLPIRGDYLSPGLALWHLTHVIDPMPSSSAASTPLFRDPSGRTLSVDSMRVWLRRGLSSLGIDPTLYGAHSLRIGGATAMAYVGAPRDITMAAGRWRSDAYLRYLRDRRGDVLRYASAVASADTDDFESDFVEIDDYEFDDDDTK